MDKFMNKLDLDDVYANISDLPVLRGISLSVAPGESVGLVGRNGAGKTTTMKTIMGIVGCVRGAVQICGQDLTSASSYRRAPLGVGYSPEDRRLIPAMTARQNILLPAWANQLDDWSERLDLVFETIPLLVELADRRAEVLSGGQQKLVAFGRALMTADNLLLLDEPFEGLAPALSEQVASAVGELQRRRGVGTLLVESDVKLVELLADRVVTIERGELVD